MTTPDQLTEILARLEVLEQRWEAGAAHAQCPYIVSSDEGTSYCRLAEQPSTSEPELASLTNEAQLDGSGGGAVAELSPAAQAIVAAFNERHEMCGPFDGNWQELCLAAALRELAQRIKGADSIRQDVIDIADEIENAPEQG
jgi:hypothetical protein